MGGLPGLALALALALGAATSGAAADTGLEYQIKAEFMERFTRFTEWPDSAFATDDAPFVVCLVGGNPFGAYLAEMIRTHTFHDRRAVIQNVAALTELEACHLVYIAAGESPRVAEILGHTSRRPIMTVGDTPGFADVGVLVNFYGKEGFVRFEINAREVKRSGLKMSSKLLKLGRIVAPPEPRR